MKSESEKKQKQGILKTAPAQQNELKTDSPLSEKDEVKQAEEKMRKTRRGML